MNSKILLLPMELLVLVSLVSAHSLYAEFPEKLASGSEAEIWIAYGHGDVSESENLSLAWASLVAPDGSKSELKLEPCQSGFLGTVQLKSPGCYMLDFESEPFIFDPSWYGSSGSASLVEKYASALMPAGSGQGYGWSEGQGLEIVPETDPYGLKSGDEFKARALWNGEPISGDYSAVVAKTPEDVLVIQHAQENEVEGSSEDGSLSFKLTRPGLWVLSFDATVDEGGRWTAESDDAQGHYEAGDEVEYGQIAPTSYLTFWVGK